MVGLKAWMRANYKTSYPWDLHCPSIYVQNVPGVVIKVEGQRGYNSGFHLVALRFCNGILYGPRFWHV